MGKMKSNEEFINQLKKINPDITVISEYIGVFNPIVVRCNKCGYTWDTTVPGNLLKGRKCPKCFKLSARGNKKLSLSEVDTLLKPFGKRLEPYKNRQSSILIKTLDGYLAYAVISRIQAGQGVAIFEKRNSYTIDNIKLWLQLNNKNIKLVSSEYERSDKHLLWECLNLNCKERFEMSWNDIRGNHGCPNCNESRGEKCVLNYLIENNIHFERQYKFTDCRNKKPLPFDFAIFQRNELLALIEYDGQQHFEPRMKFGGEKTFMKIKHNDEIKNKYCKQNKITLIRIPWKIKNIERFLANELKKLKVI